MEETTISNLPPREGLKPAAARRPGICTVQSLTLASDILRELTATLDARTATVVAAAICVFSGLDMAAQIEAIHAIQLRRVGG